MTNRRLKMVTYPILAAFDIAVWYVVIQLFRGAL